MRTEVTITAAASAGFLAKRKGVINEITAFPRRIDGWMKTEKYGHKLFRYKWVSKMQYNYVLFRRDWLALQVAPVSLDDRVDIVDQLRESGRFEALTRRSILKRNVQ